MSTSSTDTIASEILDRSAVLLNDPAKTDYTHTVLLPFLVMAVEELAEEFADSQHSLLIATTAPIQIPAGAGGIFSSDGPVQPYYPKDLVEIQRIWERAAGSSDQYIPMIRKEFIQHKIPSTENIGEFAWTNQVIVFSPPSIPREVKLDYIREANYDVAAPETPVSVMSSRSFFTYKTAAYAALFIGENQERAAILDAKAADALERMHSINNKGRQQIMTRHRPFRAAFKMRGGW